MKLQPTAKVVLVTTKGNIEVDLYPDRILSLCHEFISNCVNKKYNGCSFEKITENIVQTQIAVISNPLAKEFHSRLKFDGKGDLGLLNIEGSNQATAGGFFITTKPCPSFNSQYVIIGKISGDTIYNVLKILDCDKKEDGETPLFPITITDSYVPLRYFNDIKETKIQQHCDEPTLKKQKKKVLLDFEDEEPEDDVPFVMKSAHEIAIRKARTKYSGTSKAPYGEELIASDSYKEQPNTRQGETTEGVEKQPKEIGKEEEEESNEKQSLPHLETQREEESRSNFEQPQELDRDPLLEPCDPYLDIACDNIPFEKVQNHFFKVRREKTYN